jgi:hypothetical protein
MKNPLFYSSLLFALPGFYAYERGVDPYYLHHLLLNSFVSANHWNDPKDGWRKKIDVMYATYSFLLFFFKGVKYIKNTHMYVLGYTGVTLSLGSFALSNYYWKKKKPYWVYYHLFFHITVTGLQFLVVNSLDTKYATQYMHLN